MRGTASTWASIRVGMAVSAPHACNTMHKDLGPVHLSRLLGNRVPRPMRSSCPSFSPASRRVHSASVKQSFSVVANGRHAPALAGVRTRHNRTKHCLPVTSPPFGFLSFTGFFFLFRPCCLCRSPLFALQCELTLLPDIIISQVEKVLANTYNLMRMVMCLIGVLFLLR